MPVFEGRPGPRVRRIGMRRNRCGTRGGMTRPTAPGAVGRTAGGIGTLRSARVESDRDVFEGSARGSNAVLGSEADNMRTRLRIAA